MNPILRNILGAVSALVITGAANAVELSPLERAVWQVETSGVDGATIGDGGKARGPLQIHRGAWKDATEFDRTIGGTYEDVDRIEYAVRIFRAYCERYATERRIGRRVTDIDRARIWNGGPNGFKKSATLKYAAKVRAILEGGEG